MRLKVQASFVALFLLIISGTQTQPISSTAHFTSEGRSLIQSNGHSQEQELLVKLYGNGGIEDSTCLNHKVEENQNEHIKHELFDDTTIQEKPEVEEGPQLERKEIQELLALQAALVGVALIIPHFHHFQGLIF